MPLNIDNVGNAPQNLQQFNLEIKKARLGRGVYFTVPGLFYGENSKVSKRKNGVLVDLVKDVDYTFNGVIPGLRSENGSKVYSGIVLFSDKPENAENLVGTLQMVGGAALPPSDISSIFFQNFGVRKICAVVKKDGSVPVFSELESGVSLKAVYIDSQDPRYKLEREQIRKETIVRTASSQNADTSVRNTTLVTADPSTKPDDIIDQSGEFYPDVKIKLKKVHRANDSDELRRAVLEIEEGDTIVLSPDTTYYANTPSDFFFSKSAKIIGNGAKIAPTTPSTFWAGDSSLMRYRKQALNTGVLASPIAVNKGQMTFTFPAGWGYTPKMGDNLVFRSDTIWLTTGSYRHGICAKIVKVSGLTATLSIPFYDAFSVNRVVAYSSGNFHAEDIVFDMTGVPEGLTYTSHGLRVEGSNIPELKNLTFHGNDYAQIGLGVYDGDGGWVINCSANNFMNQFGVQGGGRLGYGINVGQNATIVQGGTFWRCKHAVTTAASREYKTLANTVRNTTIYEDVSDLAISVGGSIDAHAAYIGVPSFKDNTIYSIKNAFNVRGGAANIFENTVVRLGSDTSPFVSSQNEVPYNNLKVVRNTITQSDDAPIISRTWNTSDNVVGIEVRKNEITGGRLFNIQTLSATLRNFRFEGNEFVQSGSATTGEIQCAATAKIVGMKILDNQIDRATTGNVFVISANSAAIARQPTIDNVVISDNEVALTGGSSKFIFMQWLSGNNVTLSDNVSVHSALANSIDAIGCSLSDLKIASNTLKNANIRFGQSTQLNSADVYSSVSVDDNTLTEGQIVIHEASDDIRFVNGCRITNNKVRSSGSTRLFAWNNRAGSTAWANSTEVEVSGNNFSSTSGVASIETNANSTGNKLLYRNNVLTAPILDQSGTYYGVPIGNQIRSGTQAWRGGTIFRQEDNTLRINDDGADAVLNSPTSGEWKLGDIVWWNNPTNASGKPVANICVAAGSPGTWRGFAVTV